MTIGHSNSTASRVHRRAWSLKAWALAPLLVFALGACDIDEILEVDLPGRVDAGDLNDPSLAETLVLGVQADFECGLVDHIWYPGQWFSEFLNSSTGRPNALMELRAQLVDVYADPCNSGTGPTWVVLQLPRIAAQFARGQITSVYPQGSISDPDWMMARLFMYEGFSIQILSEAFCGMTFDGGPMMTREQAFAEAVDRFDNAIQRANATSNPGAAAVRNAAYIGRARANLHLGNLGAVAADAAMVPEGFQFVATYDATPSRRRNKIYERNNNNDDMMPHRDFLNLTISADGRLTVGDGITDPRVPIEGVPNKLGGRGLIPYRQQLKYNSRASAIPFATWREAQLMIAEVEGGQTAVDIINTLRSNPAGLHSELDTSAWPLPAFASNDPAEIDAIVREERRRELWMQGQHIGDKLRWGVPFEPMSEYGQALGPGGPMFVPFLEVASNTNISSSCP